MKKKPAVIDTPEDFVVQAWCNAEHYFSEGGGEPANAPDVPPHPNEVATRQAVTEGVYAAEDVGVPAAPKRRRS